VEDVDEVGVADGGHAVGDQDDGLPGVGQGTDLVEDALFGLGIQGGSGFVDDQDRGVAVVGAGKLYANNVAT
jgi:hypothetical protein